MTVMIVCGLDDVTTSNHSCKHVYVDTCAFAGMFILSDSVYFSSVEKLMVL